MALISTSAFSQTSGGPDNYGYEWHDSNDPQGPTYNWIDITTVGTLASGLTDDNSVGQFSMPNFVYYGQAYNQLKIGSNGWLSFDNVANISHCFPTIPSAGGNGDNLVSPYMSDLNFLTSYPSFPNIGEIYYHDDVTNDRFIISYINVPWWQAGTPDWIGSNTFQVILSRADSSIIFQYNDVDQTNLIDVGGCATDLVIGIENFDGTDGISHSTEMVPADNYAIRFYAPYTCSPTDSMLAMQSCTEFYWDQTAMTYTSTGAYIDTISNVGGCDSIVTLDLTILPLPDNNVTQNNTILTSDETGANYQWLDCDNNYSIINGANNQSYTPMTTGNYAVEVTLNTCSDTSDCYIVDYTGIEEISGKQKQLVKMVDFMGRETEFKKNTPLIFIYSDGTRERIITIEE